MANQCRTGSPSAASAGFLPVTGEQPRVLILGSFPSIKSLLHCEYYGNPQNHFWKIMDALFAIDHRLPYQERITSLTGHHLALWDVVQTCTRKGSADEAIREPVFNDISGFQTMYPTVQLIVLNGTAAGRYYHRMNITAAIEHRILPSTSPANTRYTLAEKVSAWEIVRAHCEKRQEPERLPFHPEF
ncbi:MAG: DNA-deoxyinosine glycosylase [Methanoregula sp.]|nr:DNA-deoxyinosine glycosylase [Methanoregula sp.]